MAYLLGWGSAVEWLRKNRDTSLLSMRYALPMLSLEASRHRLQRHADQASCLTRPLQLVVSSREARCPSSETSCHLFTTPDGTYPAVRIDRGFFCSGPEVAFLQMASILDEDALRFLGMELCGRYGIDADGRLFLRPQTCLPETLLQTALEMTTVRGKRKAQKVAPLVWGGAASPMEVALTLILCSTQQQGGYGIEPPELNRCIPVVGPARELWGDDFITPDLLWEHAKLVMEFDSDLYHTASWRIARDASRRDVFVELGYRVITVTTQHMRAPAELDRIATMTARRLGQDLAPCSDEAWNRRVSYQLRMRQLAEHPELLLGFG